MNNNLATKQNTNSILKRSKSSLKITSKILSTKSSLTGQNDSWMKRLWEWADENSIDDGDPYSYSFFRPLEEDSENRTLPRNKDELLKLIRLDLSNCNLTELPKEIMNLTSLQELDLLGNSLSLSLEQKNWLKSLIKNGCDIYINEDNNTSNKIMEQDKSWMERLWDWADEFFIDEYAWMESEHDKNGGIWYGLPRDKDTLLNLTEVKLNINKSTYLPKELCLLTSLTKLLVVGTKLTALPKEVGKLINLTSLDIRNSNITVLPKEIGNLTNLTALYAYSNQLTELPKEIGNLITLTNLMLENNQLAELPKEIGSMTSLECISLEDNQLTKLPKEFCNLTNLFQVHLSNNNLIELPIEIGNLINLQSIFLNNNELTQLPIVMPSSIDNIDLANNNFSKRSKREIYIGSLEI